MLYPLSYRGVSGGTRIRTKDLRIMSPACYRCTIPRLLVYGTIFRELAESLANGGI